MNEFSHVFLFALMLSVAVQLLLGWRHINHVRKHSGKVPDAFKDKILLEAHQKAANYTQAKVKTGFLEILPATVFSFALDIWRSIANA